jgi:hypothetical protein
MEGLTEESLGAEKKMPKKKNMPLPSLISRIRDTDCYPGPAIGRLSRDGLLV